MVLRCPEVPTTNPTSETARYSATSADLCYADAARAGDEAEPSMGLLDPSIYGDLTIFCVG